MRGREQKRLQDVFHGVDLPTPHEHQFTIVVEWKQSFPVPTTVNAISGPIRFDASTQRSLWGIGTVTKLRCVCGEEVDR